MQSILGSGANSVCVSQSSSVLMPEQTDGKSEISQHWKENIILNEYPIPRKHGQT